MEWRSSPVTKAFLEMIAIHKDYWTDLSLKYSREGHADAAASNAGAVMASERFFELGAQHEPQPKDLAQNSTFIDPAMRD